MSKSGYDRIKHAVRPMLPDSKSRMLSREDIECLSLLLQHFEELVAASDRLAMCSFEIVAVPDPDTDTVFYDVLYPDSSNFTQAWLKLHNARMDAVRSFIAV